jgi:triacylglycerol esterase/lipase EstA (alpha/beta hydrolase family)
MKIRSTLALVASLLALGATAGVSTAAASLPVLYSFPAGLAADALHPGAAPPGANDWSCRPTAAHPRPVVLVHGTFENMTNNWNALAPLLKNDGYCVFALNYGGMLAGHIGATGRIPASARELAGFVDRVRAATGAAKVDIVGHSQGGMMPRWYVKFLGGAAKVGRLVGLAPSNHGTTLDGIATLAGLIPGARDVTGALCGACEDQFAGSAFLRQLNAGGDTVPGVAYTVIATAYDTVVTPYASAFLSGPAVTNTTIQRKCILDASEHVALPYDHVALREVLNALDPAHARGTICTPIAPLVGG